MRGFPSCGNSRSIELSINEVSSETVAYFFICTDGSIDFLSRFHVTSQMASLRNSIQV